MAPLPLLKVTKNIPYARNPQHHKPIYSHHHVFAYHKNLAYTYAHKHMSTYRCGATAPAVLGAHNTKRVRGREPPVFHIMLWAIPGHVPWHAPDSQNWKGHDF